MRMAIVYPTTIQCIEKMASLYDDLSVIVMDGYGTLEGARRGISKRLEPLGLSDHVQVLSEHDERARDYDVLLDSLETRHYLPRWWEDCTDWHGPRIIKILWKKPYKPELTPERVEVLKHSILSTENDSNRKMWEDAIGVRVYEALYYPGDWWFNTEWIGDREELVFVLSHSAKREKIGSNEKDGLYDFREVARLCPGYHWDGDEEGRPSSKDMAAQLAHFRCYTNLDRPASTRPLCIVFTEMMALGMPIIIRNYPEHDYIRYVDGNGFICESNEEVAKMARKLISDRGLAESFSARSKEIAEQRFSKATVLKQWDILLERALQCRE